MSRKKSENDRRDACPTIIYPVRNNAPLEFLTGFTQVLSKRYAILGLQYAV